MLSPLDFYSPSVRPAANSLKVVQTGKNTSATAQN
jgi:hypothetical protein